MEPDSGSGGIKQRGGRAIRNGGRSDEGERIDEPGIGGWIQRDFRDCASRDG